MLIINYIDDEDTGYICGTNDNQDVLCQLKEIIEHNCIRVDEPIEPVIKSEIKLNLENSIPFSCAPRRLVCAEKEKLQKLWDDFCQSIYNQLSILLL